MSLSKWIDIFYYASVISLGVTFISCVTFFILSFIKIKIVS